MAKKKENYTDYSVEELHEKIAETQLGLQKLRFSHVISPIADPNVLKSMRREIARLKTELRSRELAN